MCRKEKTVARRRRRGYKFTEKTQSKRGIAALVLAAASVAVFVAIVVNSYQNRGAGSMYLGSAGVSSFILGVIALILAIKSLKEENSFKLFPYLAVVCSFLITGIWAALYVVGFLAL